MGPHDGGSDSSAYELESVQRLSDVQSYEDGLSDFRTYFGCSNFAGPYVCCSFGLTDTCSDELESNTCTDVVYSDEFCQDLVSDGYADHVESDFELSDELVPVYFPDHCCFAGVRAIFHFVWRTLDCLQPDGESR